MSTNVSALSPAKLAQLLKSPKTLAIRYKATPSSVSEIIIDAFPKDAAVAFCKIINAKFPHARLLSVKQMGTNIEPTSFTVYGVSMETFKEAFAWISDSCAGVGLKPCPVNEKNNNGFLVAHNLRLAAEQLQITSLTTRIDKYHKARLARSNGLSDVEVAGLHANSIYFDYRPLDSIIPSQEIYSLLSNFADDNDLFQILVTYVADVTWKDILEHYDDPNHIGNRSHPGGKDARQSQRQQLPSHRYINVRKAFANFGRAVNTEIQSRRKTQREERRTKK